MQKKLHWATFLGDHKNIWEASKYLRSDTNSSFAKIPGLQQMDGTTTITPAQQASLFLKNFFPPLPPITRIARKQQVKIRYHCVIAQYNK